MVPRVHAPIPLLDFFLHFDEALLSSHFDNASPKKAAFTSPSKAQLTLALRAVTVSVRRPWLTSG
jgi:hypothetical protein